MPTVGVLALQGDVREHDRALHAAGAETLAVKRPRELDAVEALVIPGGESTTIVRLAALYGLEEPLRRRIIDGMPVFGTCAGLIYLAARLTEGGQPTLGVLDATVARNAYGRQSESFEADVSVAGWDEPFPAVFIRAPQITKVGREVEVLAERAGDPILVRQDHILSSTFHPELTGDTRIHSLFLETL